MLILLRLLPLLGLFLCAFCAQGAVVFSVDVNDAVDNPTDPAALFSPYVLSDNPLSVPPYSFDINPASGALLDDFHRITPATTGTLSLGAIYRDGVFAAG